MMNDDIRAEKKAKRFWVSLVVGLLGLQVLIGGYAISMATSEHAPKVLPNYHQAALDWDQTRRQREAIQTLGWNLSVETFDIADGSRRLTVTILDRQSVGVDDLQISAMAYHRAYAHDVVVFPFHSTGDGQYQSIDAPTPWGSRAGLWHLELTLMYEGQTLRSIHTLEIP